MIICLNPFYEIFFCNIQESTNALSQKDEPAFSDLSKSLESSKEAQIALMNGIKENLESLSKNQEEAISGSEY